MPADRMKGGVEHRVPLSEPALAILRGMDEIRSGDTVFPGGKRGKPLLNMAMFPCLERLKRADLTVYGLRSTFRDWASETTHFPAEVVEMALAHAIESKVEAAYRRGNPFAKRRELIGTWARWQNSRQTRMVVHHDRRYIRGDKNAPEHAPRIL